MIVSDIARMVGNAPSAVRFYERKGILPRAPRQPNGYRDYTRDDLSEAADALRADVRSIR